MLGGAYADLPPHAASGGWSHTGLALHAATRQPDTPEERLAQPLCRRYIEGGVEIGRKSYWSERQSWHYATLPPAHAAAHVAALERARWLAVPTADLVVAGTPAAEVREAPVLDTPGEQMEAGTAENNSCVTVCRTL